jgi:hypothetical protein
MNHLIVLLILVVSFCEFLFYKYRIILPLSHSYSSRYATQTIAVSNDPFLPIAVYVHYFFFSLPSMFITFWGLLCKKCISMHRFNLSVNNSFSKWMHGLLFHGIKQALSIALENCSHSIFHLPVDTHHSFITHPLALVKTPKRLPN